MASFEEIKRDQASATETVPAGVIQAFAGAVAPSGWALCDGTVLSQTTYAKLFAALGSAWDTFAHPVDGTPTVNAGEFALPNLKGLYLAGTGNSGGDIRSLGVFQAQKTAKNGLGSSTSGVTINKNQWNSNQTAHTHGLAVQRMTQGTTQTSDRQVPVTGGSSYGGQTWVSNTASSSWSSTNASGTAAAQTITGDNETRPQTAPVSYIIKL